MPFLSRSPVAQRWSRLSLVGLAALVVSTGGACATQKGAEGVSYAETAQANYERGLREFADENYEEATQFFNFVRNKFPFVRFAALAELRIADVLFAEEKFTTAIDAYKLFIRFHPSHASVIDGYAAFRVAMGYVKQIPGDWFLVPPGYEKDQAATREAMRELKQFLAIYPHSKYQKEAHALLQQCVKRLVDHELYVARFYLERDQPQATILRLEGVLSRYPDAAVNPEVMLLLGKTYLMLRERARAQQTFAALIDKYPDTPYSAQAKLFLDYIGEQNISERHTNERN